MKRLLVGRPLESGRLGETPLPKRVALPIFCGDPLSSVAAEVAAGPGERPRALAGNHVLVLVASVDAPSLRAPPYAKTLRPASLTAVTVAEDPAEAEVLRASWEAHGIDVPLRVLGSPYRSIVQPVLRHVREAPERRGDSVVSVVVPEYAVGHRWEQPLHKQSALRLKARLLFMKNVVVVDVPYRPASAREPAAERARAAEEAKAAGAAEEADAAKAAGTEDRP
ncbi:MULTISPECIES: hypothetical protein [unclassified Streptomyces]|uniref:hypothetical protein n=1 Tax=unclassified Streptomyces TaxID=2593676 RepID=UPI0033B9807D